MSLLVIAAHPRIEQSRVNKRWLAELRGYADRISVHELYRTYPDFTINAVYEQDLMVRHERIVLQFPIQWYGMPALLKQWLDDVFTTTWLYGTGGTAVAGKELVLALSVGGEESSYRSGGMIGYTISELMRPVQVFANQVGMTFLPAYSFYGANKATIDQIEQSALRYVEHVTSADLNPIVVRQRMLNEMGKANPAP